MNRDQLARHLYIHADDHLNPPSGWRADGAEDWDAGSVSAKDVADCYARADQLIADGQVAR